MKALKTIFIVLSLCLSSVYAVDNSEFNSNIDNPNSFYIKLPSTGISLVKDYPRMSGIGFGYSHGAHRGDARLGVMDVKVQEMDNYIFIEPFVQGNYYYNIFDSNKVSIFITGGLISCLKVSGELGAGLTVNLIKNRMYLDLEGSILIPLIEYKQFVCECSSYSQNMLLTHASLSLRFHI